MDYARALRILRAARNLTQNAVGQLIGDHESNVSRYESGKRTPSLDKAQELAKTLGCPFDLFLLLAGDEDTPCPPDDFRRVMAVLRHNGEAQ